MPSYIDLGLIVIVLISAILSMVRGFTREVLAIGSWAAAAAAAYLFYPRLMPYVTPYVHKEPLPQAISAAVVFFVTLIIVSIVTVRISDLILDSRVGAVDRSLGFLFGAARGFLLGVIAFAIFNWLVEEKQQPEWARNAKTRPILLATVESVINWLPEDVGHTIEAWWKKTKAVGGATDEPPDESRAAPSTDTAVPTADPPPLRKSDAPPAPSAGPPSGDKQKLDAILNNKPATPAKPAPAKP